MNEITEAKKVQIIAAICEGASIRATARMCEVSKSTVSRLIALVAEAAAIYQDRAFRNLNIERVECDEIWAFCTAKQRHVPVEHEDDANYGDIWTWVALDADTKLVPTWHVGDRTVEDCFMFMSDLRDRIRIGNRIQLSTDGLAAYQLVVDALWRNAIDFGVVIKEYGAVDNDHRYSPATCKSIEKRVICGSPDPDLISTSYIERQNLTMRMNMRRMTRLTNAFSKKAENHAHATALHFAYYNLCRPHETLTKAAKRKTTPAMAAGVERAPWSVRQLVELLDRYGVIESAA